jgi:hypothetical protein
VRIDVGEQLGHRRTAVADDGPGHRIEDLGMYFRGTGQEEPAELGVWFHAHKVRRRRSDDKVRAGVDGAGMGSELPRMQYHVMTEVSPEDVIDRAKTFFATNSSLSVREPAAGTLALTGELGTATIRVDRAHGHTNVRAETDRVAGLDITDLTKRFLYTLGHV